MKSKSNELEIIFEIEDFESMRMKNLYLFILSKTDFGLEKQTTKKNDKIVTPNESFIATQWGMSDYRVFIRRVLRSTLPECYIHEDKEPEKVPSLDLYRLVKILESLESYYASILNKPTKGMRILNTSAKFTTKDKLKALRLYSELSKEERHRLKIPMNSNSKLLDEIFYRLEDTSEENHKKMLSDLYKSTVFYPNKILNTKKNNISLIEDTVRDMLDCNFNIPAEEYLVEVQERTNKIKKELERILFQSGLQQNSEVLETSTIEEEINNLSPDIIYRLSKSLLDNEMVTREFPIIIEWIEVKRVRPLPLKIYSKDSENKGLINKELVDDDERLSISGLERQVAYSVTVHFKIKGEEVRFHEKMTGIGSPLSLATAAINRFLLWDIECLKKKDIFPIAKEIFVHSEILGDSHGVSAWCHTVVELCKYQDIKNAIKLNKKDEPINVHGESSSYGDFCSFDVLESFVKSRLISRLRAIKNLGIAPEDYLKDLNKKVKEQLVSRMAKRHLKFYPFSRWAMNNTVESELLESYRILNLDEKGVIFEDCKDKNGDCNEWSLVAYDAHLVLAEALLIEGKQIAAAQYLEHISTHLRKHGNILGELLHCKYYYLMALQSYLYDLDTRSPMIRVSKISEAFDYIEKAKNCLKEKVRICNIVDDLSQSNAHPFFELSGKIHCLEARIYLGFSSLAPVNRGVTVSKSDNIKQVLIRLEKARICAAKDGSSDSYAIYSSFQSRIYFLMAFSANDEYIENLALDKNSCLEWGNRLLKHSVICYIETGRKSYSDLKFNAGTKHESFDFGSLDQDEIDEKKGKKKLRIKVSPFIRELNKIEENKSQKDEYYDKENNILSIPYFDILKKDTELKNEDPITYLFGFQSCNILLTYGVQKISCATEENFLNETDEAIRHLIVAWAIAKDGGNPHKENLIKSTVKIIERNYEIHKCNKTLPEKYKIASIGGLYPYRISQTVLSSSFMIILCEILRMIYLHQKKEIKDKDIKDFTQVIDFFINKDGLYEKDEAELSSIAKRSNQERFNGHLNENIENIKKYYEDVIFELKLKVLNRDLSQSIYSEIDYISWRGILLKNLLCFISGDVRDEGKRIDYFE